MNQGATLPDTLIRGKKSTMDIIEKSLREKLEDTTQSALARKVGISPQMMCDILMKRRDYSPKLLKYLKYKRIISYERITSGK